MSPRPGYLQGLALGQLVHHWMFGQGQVLRSYQVDGVERAWIDFGPRGVCLLRVDQDTRLVDPAAAPADRPRAAWEDLLDESTPLAPLGLAPWVAWLGRAVVDDRAVFRAALSEFKLSQLGAYPVMRLDAAPPGWPEVEVLIYPPVLDRLAKVHAGVIVLSAPQGQRPYEAWPFYSDWSHPHHVAPHCIRVCKDRVEAVVDADLLVGDASFPVTFALPTFDRGRQFLRGGVPVKVTLAALAYECRPSPAQTFTVQHDQQTIDALLRFGVDPVSAPDGSTLYSTEGMTWWSPLERRSDLVRFRGRVVQARQISLPPHQRDGWHLRLRISCLGSGEWLLDVVFEASVWEADDAPAIGSDVDGYAWLVGECLGSVLAPNLAQSERARKA